METTMNQSISKSFVINKTKPSLLKKFLAYCTTQEKNRLLWLGVSLTAHGCVLTPLTLLAVLLSGTNLLLFMIALVAMAITVVTNLAAMPTKVTIPAFLISVILDIIVIISCAAAGFNIANTYI